MTTDQARDIFLAYIDSPDYEMDYHCLHPKPRFQFYFGIYLCFMLLTLPIGIWLLLKVRRRNQQLADQLTAHRQHLRQAHPIILHGLHLNPLLLERRLSYAPGIVIGTFAEDQHAHLQDLTQITADIIAIHKDATHPHNPDICALFAQQTYTPGRRRPIPAELTRGLDVYAFDLMITARHLPDGPSDALLFPCLATPGPAGQPILIPHTIAAPYLQPAAKS